VLFISNTEGRSVPLRANP